MYRKEIEEAVAKWNGEVGFELFAITKLGADVIIIVEVNSPFGLRGATQFAREVGVLQAAVYLFAIETPPGDPGTVETIMHELGHVVGLTHDELTGSLMFGTYQGKPGRTLTAQDRALVIQRYR